MTQAIILFAHGSRDPEWAEPFERLRAAVAALSPGIPVELAYLEVMQPDLPAAISALAARGAQSITIVPAFMAQGAHLKRDLPKIVQDLREQQPTMTLTLQPALGEAQPVIDAMAQHIAASMK
jgi:sirohydrochlorin cobaltochelatase